VGLTWNAADVAAVLTSMLGGGELPDQMDMPRLAGPSFDQVLAGGTPVGVSTGRTVSPTLRAMISPPSLRCRSSQTTAGWTSPRSRQR
jgi:vanillate/3-O-methylgallate O-demethylase